MLVMQPGLQRSTVVVGVCSDDAMQVDSAAKKSLLGDGPVGTSTYLPLEQVPKLRPLA